MTIRVSEEEWQKSSLSSNHEASIAVCNARVTLDCHEILAESFGFPLSFSAVLLRSIDAVATVRLIRVVQSDTHQIQRCDESDWMSFAIQRIRIATELKSSLAPVIGNDAQASRTLSAVLCRSRLNSMKLNFWQGVCIGICITWMHST